MTAHTLAAADLVVRRAISRELLDDMPHAELMPVVDSLAHEMAWELHARIFQRQHAIWIDTPATWWDHLREALRPRTPQWVLTRWPIRYTHHTITGRQLFPDVIAPKGQRTVTLLTHDTPQEVSHA